MRSTTATCWPWQVRGGLPGRCLLYGKPTAHRLSIAAGAVASAAADFRALLRKAYCLTMVLAMLWALGEGWSTQDSWVGWRAGNAAAPH